MATSGFTDALLGNLPADIKKALTEVMRYVLPNGRFGPVSHQAKTENFQAYYVQGVTSSVANTEFSIVHGMGRAPYVAIPVLPLDFIGVTFVGLTVTRVADSQRVYLRSASTGATVTLYVE